MSRASKQYVTNVSSYYSSIFVTVKRRLEQSALHEKENARGAHVVHPLGVVPTTSSELCE